MHVTWGLICDSLLERFINVLDGIDSCFLDDQTLESWRKPERLGKQRIAGLDFNHQRISAAAEALLKICWT